MTIERLIGEGRIEIDPYDPALLQPSSVDVRVDRYFRVFRNSRYPFIDVKLEQEDLTELVEVGEEAFILHPASSCSARRSSGSSCRTISWPGWKEVELGEARAADPLDRGLHRPGLGRARHARALERRRTCRSRSTRDEDRPAFVPAADKPAENPYGSGGLGSKYQGQRGPTPSRYWKNFQQ